MPAPWSNEFGLLVAVLATWRLSHLIAREDGPFDLVLRVRAELGDSLAGRAMDCPYCLSLWLAAPFAFLLADRLAPWVAAWLAVSGGACVIEAALVALAAQRRDTPRAAPAPSPELPEGDT